MANNFTFVDWSFIVGFLVISLFIGLIARRRISTVDDFLHHARGDAFSSHNMIIYLFE
jgi:hypothetical protein